MAVSRTTIRRRSACSREFVDTAVLGQSGVGVAGRVNADTVDMAALHAGEHRPVRIANPTARLSRTHWSRLRCAEIKTAKAGSQTL
jgi:hypothetical protein